MPPQFMRSLLGLLLAIATLGLTARAAADPSPADRAAAEALFEDGRALMQAGRFTEACPKLAESHRLDPGVGILLYLGDCYEHNGQLASAWAAFKEAAPAARLQGQADREKTATDRANALEPRLPRLALTVPEASRIAGLVVLRDATIVNPPLFGAAIPMDAGAYTITAKAPGRRTWSIQIETKDGRIAQVTIPVLEPIGPPAAVPAPAPNPVDPGVPWGIHHVAGFGLGGLGVAGLIAGAVLGAQTKSDWDAAQEHCDSGKPRRCDADGVDLAARANTLGTASTVLVAVGGAALAAGVIVLATAPWSDDTEPATALVVPWASPDGAGLWLGVGY